MIEADRLARQGRLKRLFDTAPIKHSLGMDLDYDAEGRAVFTLPYNPGFDHALGGVHGGVLATLLDNAGWFTIAPHYDCWISTVEFQTRLLEPVRAEALVATGRVVQLGRRLSTATMEVRAGARLVAIGSGVYTVSSIPIDPA